MASAVKRVHGQLPLFEVDTDSRRLVYSPGALLVGARSSAESGASFRELETQARDAQVRWREWIESPFQLECLSVYFGNHCDFRCSYCFAATQTRNRPQVLLDEAAVDGAADLVVSHCARRQATFQLALHGSGEPTLEWQSVRRITSSTQKKAQSAGVPWRGYIATNGAVGPEQARWLTASFDEIGISCDGPPDIQDRQRPTITGGPTSQLVESAARAITAAKGNLTVRATITPQTMSRQAEIVRYLHTALEAHRIRFEPVYCNPNRESGQFREADAVEFVEHFLEAEEMAAELGCNLSLSGVRLDELHGPYCDVLRRTLRLLPDGRAITCFHRFDTSSPDMDELITGHWDADARRYVLHSDRIEDLRRRAARIPDSCSDCLNIYHCARDCPDYCYATAVSPGSESGGFRCRVNRLYAERSLLKAAGVRRPPGGFRVRHRPDGEKAVLAHLQGAQGVVDPAPILEQWVQIKQRFWTDPRRLPAPVWAERGFEDGGSEAWARIRSSKHRTGGPMSVYVHVPFCRKRCGFCDCYSVPLPRSHREKELRFGRALEHEVDAWASLDGLSDRPVTTIHFGGGTPNCLTPEVLGPVLDLFHSRFRIEPATEWALESTTSLLTDEHLDELQNWGFQRLHVGIQTLEEDVRRRIGRRESGKQAARRVAAALEKGFTVSVDLIYGLPGQTVGGYLRSLSDLIAIGVDGFSLYGLQVTDKNRRFLTRLGVRETDSLFEYCLFQAAHQFLDRHGYQKNHFTHFARKRDANLYYTHANRGEDLVALGPTADGVIGGYRYRHTGLPEYLASADLAQPAIEGGLTETPVEQSLRPAIAELMCGQVSPQRLRELDAEALLINWRRQGLAGVAPGSSRFVLTANGSWFVSSMIRELRRSFTMDRPFTTL